MSRPPVKPEYLGDGLYATFDGYMIALTANDPRTGPTVYVEPSVWEALERYADRCWPREVKPHG